MSRAGFAPHGIRGAFNIFEDQVAVVVRLETFMCTDPLRRASRLRFLAFTGFQRRSASFTSCSTSPARTHDGTELHRIISTFVCNTTRSSPSATTLTWTLTPCSSSSSLSRITMAFPDTLSKAAPEYELVRSTMSPGFAKSGKSESHPWPNFIILYFDLFVDLC